MDKRKFHLCVTAIIKNEALYIEEWICFHRVLGVDHFFIFDNNSEDDIDNVLRSYINHGIVTLIRWPMLGGQADAYNYSAHFLGHTTEWMAYIDIDEFIVLKETGSIPEFLSALEGADQLLIPWRNFYFSGHEKRPPGLVIENYTLAENVPPGGLASINAKAIVRPAVVKRVSAHNGTTTSQATVDGLNRRVPETHALEVPNYDRIQLNHYYTKSYEEFRAKIGRGQVSGGTEKGMFPFDHPGYDTPDTSALRYVEATRRQMELMRSLSPNPFRYGSQQMKVGPEWRDPFSWAAKVAISNYLDDAPALSMTMPVEFENFGKAGDIVARASDFERSPSIGAFRQSIHVTDMIRRLGNDVVCDLAAEPSRHIVASEGAALTRGAESIVLKRSSDTAKLTISTQRIDKSRCFAVGFSLRTPGSLRLQVAPSSLRDNDRQFPAKKVEMPSPGYYCGFLELNKDPVRAAGLDVVFSNASADLEIFDMFAVAYG